MSGPYCESCEHYAAYPAFANAGECMDTTKVIYSSSGEPINSQPEVRAKNYCTNHQWKEPKSQ